MPVRTPGNEISHHPSESIPLEQTQAGVIGNERLPALVSFVLLVLIIVELVTSAVLRSWLPARFGHCFGVRGSSARRVYALGRSDHGSFLTAPHYAHFRYHPLHFDHLDGFGDFHRDCAIVEAISL